MPVPAFVPGLAAVDVDSLHTLQVHLPIVPVLAEGTGCWNQVGLEEVAEECSSAWAFHSQAIAEFGLVAVLVDIADLKDVGFVVTVSVGNCSLNIAAMEM